MKFRISLTNLGTASTTEIPSPWLMDGTIGIGVAWSFVYLPNLYAPTKSLGTPLRWRNIDLVVFSHVNSSSPNGEPCQLWVSLQLCSSRVLRAGLGFVQICTFKRDWRIFTVQGLESLEDILFRNQIVFESINFYSPRTAFRKLHLNKLQRM